MQVRSIGEIWRRFLAFVIDCLILYVVGRGVGAALFNSLLRVGPWGLLLGFCIALLYFAILDSRIGDGQTVGKRCLQLRVVDTHGNTISFGKSLVRYSVFAAPHFLNGLQLPLSRTPWMVPPLISVIGFGIGGTTLYLIVFNRQTRQGLHDLAVRSYVAKATESGPIKTEPILDIHWAILRSLLILLIIFSIGLAAIGHKLEKWGPAAQRQQDRRLIEQMDHVQRARVNVQRPLKWNNTGAKKTLAISVQWMGESGDREEFSNQVARLILQNDPRVQEYDLISIVMIREYDLGIASEKNSLTFVHTPVVWCQRVLGASPVQCPTSLHQ